VSTSDRSEIFLLSVGESRGDNKEFGKSRGLSDLIVVVRWSSQERVFIAPMCSLAVYYLDSTLVDALNV